MSLLIIGSAGYIAPNHFLYANQIIQPQLQKRTTHKTAAVSPQPQPQPTPIPQPVPAPSTKNPTVVTTTPSQNKSSTQHIEPIQRDVDFSIQTSITSVVSGRTFQLTVHSVGGEELEYFPDVTTDSPFRILAPVPPFAQYTSDPVTYNIMAVYGTTPGSYNIGVSAIPKDINEHRTLKTVPIAITAPLAQ